MRTRFRTWGRLLVGVAALIGLYYLVPIEPVSDAGRIVGLVAGLLLAVGLLGWAIAAQVRPLRTGGAARSTIIGLLMLAGLVVVAFAFGFFLLQRHDPSQFAGLSTRTDALYFTVTVLATVGFGDVHPTGQVARALVTAQIVFNLAFFGLVVNLLTERLQSRRHRAKPALNEYP